MKPFRLRRCAAVLAVPLSVWMLAYGLHRSGVRINLSASEPPGFYFMQAVRPGSRIERGSLIGFCPDIRQQDYPFVLKGGCPGGAAPFLKHVIAIPGDTVEETGAGVWINGQAIPDSQPRGHSQTDGIALARWRGQAVLGKDEYWVYGAGAPADSFDSRYFGPVRAARIVSLERPKERGN